MLNVKTMLTACVAALALSATTYAGTVKTYQVTGPVLAVTDDTVVVQKGKDKWEIARDSATKITGTLEVGAKVTIEYRMTATSVDVKGGGTTSSTKKKK